ncbi:helix-turn-helix domain-containing protein [Enterococcus faecalis]|uniref:helix-turn-helix domain-containing protein n=1 Tax=Enterococcus faecalis TaxID=1351 RepID=UPI00046C8A92|nr:helix-turn-helix transcriptional regulator [Enterococcus faecalis]EJZ8852837.1 helix-turn-helix transcriptional regulator [Enterococcus faecalis]EKK5901602.1 helix-turn-helix transcriptional regulator [Enterococcus faecalis]MDH5042068.1 helix-turn-helix transcriptional regulator [Enterococcus faecalis]PQF09525.1 XRE family transcriptional regulator [Enterococcus faecalis]HBG9552080.1 helix-turn-helix transcriptional regulator [Enterococcus faecalis]
MNTYEIIKELTKRKKMSIRQLEITLGYSNGYFSKWKKVSPNSEGLQKVADYFNVSVDYLLGRTDNTKSTDEKNSDDLDDVLDNVMSFDGEPLDDHDREVIRAYLKGRFGK